MYLLYRAVKRTEQSNVLKGLGTTPAHMGTHQGDAINTLYAKLKTVSVFRMEIFWVYSLRATQVVVFPSPW